MRTLAAIVVLASLGGVPLTAQGGKRFTLSGTVVDGLSNRPVAGAEVMVQTPQWEQMGSSAVSDAQGRFAFAGMPAGEYILSATVSGIGTVQYGEAADAGLSTVHLGAKGENKSVVFAIAPRGSIEGKVRDEFGDPMPAMDVALQRPGWQHGKTILTNVGQKATDDRGFFRFGNLPPGNYTVCTGERTIPAPVPGVVDFSARVQNRFYMRTCYPAANGANSRTFPLAPGQTAQVDLTPLSAALATVSGHIRNAPPSSGYTAYLSPEQGTGSSWNYGATMDSQGAFTIRGVPPGRYHLHAAAYLNAPAGGTQKHWNTELPVEVGGSDVSGLEVAVDSGSTLDVLFHGLTGSEDLNKAGISLRSAETTRGASRDKDGVFHIEGIGAGRYWIGTGVPENLCVTSVKLGDREVRGAPVEIVDGAALRAEVTVSKECLSVGLRVVRNGEAVPGAKLVLLLSGTPKDPGDMLEDFVNDEGERSFSGLTPGRYLAWAWPVSGKDVSAGPASLAAVEKQATVVEVAAGPAVQIDVPVLHDEDKAP